MADLAWIPIHTPLSLNPRPYYNVAVGSWSSQFTPPGSEQLTKHWNMVGASSQMSFPCLPLTPTPSSPSLMLPVHLFQCLLSVRISTESTCERNLGVAETRKMMLPTQRSLCMAPQPLEQRSPPFLAPGTSFMGDNVSGDWGAGVISG